MRVLFVNNFKGPDYQNDVVYHGLIENKHEVYETAFPAYMLTSYPNPKQLYGKGFTVFAKLTHTPNLDSPEVILEKIKSKFYDIVVYGSVHRDLSFLQQVVNVYSKDEVYFIDGEDHPTPLLELLQFGKYFKRERLTEETLPISFAIPESQLRKLPVHKSKHLATIIPGNKVTYIFNTEEEYYEDYAQSYFGITCQKSGWDCMRHYEILANKCVPFFTDLQNCPVSTLYNFPKDLILESNRYAREGKLPPDYEQLNQELFTYTSEHLTTQKLVASIL